MNDASATSWSGGSPPDTSKNDDIDASIVVSFSSPSLPIVVTDDITFDNADDGDDDINDEVVAAEFCDICWVDDTLDEDEFLLSRLCFEDLCCLCFCCWYWCCNFSFCIYSNRFFRSSVPGLLAGVWSLLFDDFRLRCPVEDEAELFPCSNSPRFVMDESVGVDDDLFSISSLAAIVVVGNTAVSRFSLLLLLMYIPALPSKLNLDDDKISSTLILLLLAASLLLLFVKLLPLLVVFLLRVLTAGLAGDLVAVTKVLTPRRSVEDIIYAGS